jgi:hypothetical protein
MPDPTKPVLKAQAIEPDSTKPKTEGTELDPAKPIMRAQPVEPAAKEIRRAEPVRPRDEIPIDQILKPTPPPPADLGDQE